MFVKALAVCLLLVCFASGQDSGSDWQEHSASDGNMYAYYVAKAPVKNWFHAEAFCNQYSGNLVSVLDEKEKDFVKSRLLDADGGAQSQNYWVGLTKYMQDKWKWVASGEAVDMTKIFPTDEPDQVNNERHMCGTTMSNGVFHKMHCDTALPFVCSRRVGATGTLPTPTEQPKIDSACPHGWYGTDGTGNKCFKIFDEEKVTKNEALTRCRAVTEGPYADLASIRNIQESALITAIIPADIQGLHIGLYVEEYGGAFFWNDNSPYDFENFCNHDSICREPTKSYNEKCVEIWYHPVPGTWNDFPCEEKRGYICQIYKNPENHLVTEKPQKDCSIHNTGTDHWINYGDNCYLYVEKEASWAAQALSCEGKSKNSKMVTVHSESENSALLIAVNGRGKNIWIGLNDIDGEMTWVDGWYPYYLHWDERQPNNNDGNNTCGAYNFQNGKWYLENCDRTDMHTVCKISETPKVTKPPPIDGSCPDEVFVHDSLWAKEGSYCYLVATGTASWWNALHECQLYPGGNLVSIENMQENTYLHNLMKPHEKRYGGFWTGLHYRAKAKEFAWIDGSEVVFESWAPGEPNGEPDGSDYNKQECVEMLLTTRPGLWNDAPCGNVKPYVCKAEKIEKITRPEDVGTCPEGYDGFGAKCYTYQVDVPMNYIQAQQQCKSLDPKSSVAVIEDKFTQEHVWSELYDREDLPGKSRYHFLIGLKREINPTNGKYHYKWHNGNVLGAYNNWGLGQPDMKHDGDCVHMLSDDGQGKWAVVGCDINQFFACERPKDPAGLSAGAIAGTVIGVLIAVILLTAGILFALDKFGYVDMKQKYEDTKNSLGFQNENYNNFDNEAAS